MPQARQDRGHQLRRRRARQAAQLYLRRGQGRADPLPAGLALAAVAQRRGGLHLQDGPRGLSHDPQPRQGLLVFDAGASGPDHRRYAAIAPLQPLRPGILGTGDVGGALDSARFKYRLSEALGCPGSDVDGMVIGGHSDTGKTTALLEAAVNAQKQGILPVFIITEMKWSWDHAKEMGLQVEEVKDENGTVTDYEGHFLYADRGQLNTIEDVAVYIADLMDEQAKGNLPYDLLFVWDSVGSIPCQMSIEQGKNNPMWNAGAIATQFGNFINQKIVLSRKEEMPYTNTFLIINKTGVAPAEGPMARPRMTNKGGDTFFYDASLVLTFGNITNSGTSKLKATKDGKEVEFAVRTKVAVDKNHVTGLQTKNTVVATIHGFIQDDNKDITDYKKQHAHEWVHILGSIDGIGLAEDKSEWEESKENIEAVKN